MAALLHQTKTVVEGHAIAAADELDHKTNSDVNIIKKDDEDAIELRKDNM